MEWIFEIENLSESIERRTKDEQYCGERQQW